MNDLGKSEGIAVRVLSYFLVDDAEDTYNIQMTSSMSHTDRHETDTWPHVIKALLETQITDDMLQTAYDEVTRARQGPKEPVANFITRLQDLVRRCHGVFPQAEMANMVLRGMKPAIRNRIQQTVNSLPSHEKISLPKIRQLSVQEYNAQRDQMKEMLSASTSRASKTVGAKEGNTMHIGGPMPGLLSPPSSPSTSQLYSVAMDSRPAKSAQDPVDMVNSTVGLSYLFEIT